MVGYSVTAARSAYRSTIEPEKRELLQLSDSLRALPCPTKVVVIGGGVAGLTAAHELQERGLKVVVYERNTVLGGKARSFIIPEDTKKVILGKPAEQHPSDLTKAGATTKFDADPTAKQGLSAIAGLPAEHGIRFFPGFYKHLTDTLSRISYREEDYPKRLRHVVDNLVNVDRSAYARQGKPFFTFPTAGPKTIDEWIRAVTKMFDNPALGLDPFEASFAAVNLATAMTMCQERRECELDGRSWWDYMRADVMSQSYRSVIVNGLTDFAAMDVRHSSTKPVINILARLLNDFMRPDGTMDRILNGPTSEVWIDKWEAFLSPPDWIPNHAYIAGELITHEAANTDGKVEKKVVQCREDHKSKPSWKEDSAHWMETGRIAVQFQKGKAVHSLGFNEGDNKVTAIELSDRTQVKADYFVVAAPIEAMIEILENTVAKTPEIEVHAPSLVNLRSDMLKTNWMTGIMFYLKEDVTMDTGHVFYLDSKWALTAISQNQFWRRKVWNYNHQAHGILSVIISDWWFTISARIGKTAQQTDNIHELAQETLAQIRDHLLGSTLTNVDWTNIAGFYLTPAIIYRDTFTTLERLNMLGLMPAQEFARRKKVLMEDKNRQVRSDKPPYDFVSDESVFELKKDELKDYIDRNLEPMFINTVNSWELRPAARTEIGNLFLASDYVKTSTDLATMEGANEAARRAVNALLDHMEEPEIDKITKLEDIGKKKKVRRLRRCRIFKFDEPAIFAPFRRFDKMMYDRGLPHAFSRPKIGASVGKRLQEWWEYIS